MAKTIKELTQDLLQAPSACKEVKEAAQNYLDAAGTEKEADAATAYVKELEADIMPIDGLISFAGSDMGAQVFGADDAKKILAHAEEIKAGLYRIEQSFFSDEGGLLSFLKDNLNTLNNLRKVYQPAGELKLRSSFH